MEFVKKVRRFKYILFLLLLIFACESSPPPEPVIQDPLVLQEIAPLPRAVVARQVVTEYEPVYSSFRIIEVSEVNGVQKFFIVRIGADKTGIAVGVTGDIGEDQAFKRIIGIYKILELHDNFFRCEIMELEYRIGNAAYVRIKTGEKIKEPATN
jgi:hypothetical protein